MGYANRGHGLEAVGPDPPYLGCNDWSHNFAGATGGVSPGATDLFVEPLFCDLGHDDVHLSAISPLLDEPGCGLIGALGQGCAEPVGVSPVAALSGLALSARPRPVREHVEFAWRGGALPARLEVYDVSGALRWRAPLARESGTLAWQPRDLEGRRLPAGLYFARLVSRDGTAGATIVIL